MNTGLSDVPRVVLGLCAALAGIDAGRARHHVIPAIRAAVPVRFVRLAVGGEPDDADGVARRWAGRWAPDIELEVPQYCSVELAVAAARCMPAGGTVVLGTGVWSPPEPPAETAARSAAIAAALPPGVRVCVCIEQQKRECRFGPLAPHLAALCKAFRASGHGVAILGPQRSLSVIGSAAVVEERFGRDRLPETPVPWFASLRPAAASVLVRLRIAVPNRGSPLFPTFTGTLLSLLSDTNAVPRLRDLEIVGALQASELVRLCPTIAQLDRLVVEISDLDAGHAAAVAPHLGRLTVLTVTFARTDNVRALLAGTCSAVLRDLSVTVSGCAVPEVADLVAGHLRSTQTTAAGCRVRVNGVVSALVRGDWAQVSDEHSTELLRHFPCASLRLAYPDWALQGRYEGTGWRTLSGLRAPRRIEIVHEIDWAKWSRRLGPSGSSLLERYGQTETEIDADVSAAGAAEFLAIEARVAAWPVSCVLRVVVARRVLDEIRARPVEVRDLPAGYVEVVLRAKLLFSL